MMTAGRLTLTAGIALPTTDVASSDHIWLTPSDGGDTEIYDGTDWVARKFAADVPLALGAAHGASNNFSVFEYWDGAAVALGTGPAWLGNIVGGYGMSPGTGPGTAETEMLAGRPVNKYPITLTNGASSVVIPARQAKLYGGFRTVATGIACDTARQRWLSNVYNLAERPIARIRPMSGLTWPQSAAGWRGADNDPSNMVSAFAAIGGTAVKLKVRALVSSGGPSLNAYVGIGVMSYFVNSAYGGYTSCGVAPLPVGCEFEGTLGQGMNIYNWLEQIQPAPNVTFTWYDSGPIDVYPVGISGTIWA